MIDLEWRHQELIHLVWAALAIVGALAFLELRSREALSGFLSPIMQRRLTAKSSTERTLLRLFLVLGCLVFGIAALMRPLAHGEAHARH